MRQKEEKEREGKEGEEEGKEEEKEGEERGKKGGERKKEGEGEIQVSICKKTSPDFAIWRSADIPSCRVIKVQHITSYTKKFAQNEKWSSFSFQSS